MKTNDRQGEYWLKQNDNRDGFHAIYDHKMEALYTVQLIHTKTPKLLHNILNIQYLTKWNKLQLVSVLNPKDITGRH